MGRMLYLSIVFGLCLEGAMSKTFVRFYCLDGSPENPAKLDVSSKSLGEVCDNFKVVVGLMGDDDSLTAQVVVNHTGSGFLGTGSTVFTSPTFGADVREVNLSTVALPSSYSSACGLSFLTAVLLNSTTDEVLDFTVLSLEAECEDQPGLSLRLTKSTSPNLMGAARGMRNPFESTGVESVEVVNSMAVCQNASSNVNGSDPRCDSLTEMKARWEYSQPEVVAFFIPMDHYQYSEFEFNFNIFNPTYDMNGSLPWTMDSMWSPSRQLEFIRNMSAFAKPIFLHDGPLLEMNSPPKDGIFGPVNAGQVVGQLNLDDTEFPLTGAYMGALVIVLDPLEKLPDQDRTDNYFFQLIYVNSTDEDYVEIPSERLCTAIAGPSGSVGMIRHVEGEKDDSLVFSTKTGSFSKVFGRRGNMIKVQAQLVTMQADNERCQNLDMLRNMNGAAPSIFEEVNAILKEFQANLDNVEAEEIEPIKKLSSVVTRILDLGNNNEQLRHMVLGSLKKMKNGGMRPDFDDYKPGGRPDFNNYGPGGRPDFNNYGPGGRPDWGQDHGYDSHRPWWGSQGSNSFMSGSQPGWGYTKPYFGPESSYQGSWQGHGSGSFQYQSGMYGSFSPGMEPITRPLYGHDSSYHGWSGYTTPGWYSHNSNTGSYYSSWFDDSAIKDKMDAHENRTFSEFTSAMKSMVGNMDLTNRTVASRMLPIMKELFSESGLKDKSAEYLDKLKGLLDLDDNEGEDESSLFRKKRQIEFDFDGRPVEKGPMDGMRGGESDTMNRMRKEGFGGQDGLARMRPDFGGSGERMGKQDGKMRKDGFEGMAGGRDGREKMKPDFDGSDFEGISDRMGERRGGFADKDAKNGRMGQASGRFGGDEDRMGGERGNHPKGGRNGYSGGYGKRDNMTIQAAKALQGFLMMPDDLPRELRQYSECLMSILWSKINPPKADACSVLPADLKSEIREAMMIILREELDDQVLTNLGMMSGMIMSHIRMLVKENPLPIQRKDVDEIFLKTGMLIEKKLNYSATVFNKTDSTAMPLFKAMNTTEIKAKMAKTLLRIQVARMEEDDHIRKDGMPGDEATADELCRSYLPILAAKAGYLPDSDRNTGFMAWRQDEGKIKVGKFCPMTRMWMWNTVAACSCH